MEENMKRFSPEWFRAKAAEYADYEADSRERFAWFQSEYGIEQLKALSGMELLRKMFCNDTDKMENMCYELEKGSKIGTRFGSIRGGSAHKFGLFYQRGKNSWVAGSAQKPQELTEAEAIEVGTKIRDNLVAGAEEIIEFGTPNSVENYRLLWDKVSKHVIDYIWILKYYRLIFPDLFCSAYNTNQERHLLFVLQIMPKDSCFERMGQIALHAKEMGISPEMLSITIEKEIGWYKPIYRIGTGDAGSSDFVDWVSGGYCALGFHEIGDYRQYCDSKGNPDKKNIADALLEKNDTYNEGTAKRKAGEIYDFITAAGKGETIVAAMNGQNLLDIGFVNGDLEYNVSVDHFNNRRSVDWRCVLPEPVKIPYFEAKLTSFKEMSNPENMLFLYKLLYYDEQPEAVPSADDSGWWPTLEEYDPGISKEQWLELLNDKDFLGPEWGAFLAEFFVEKEGASCKMIAVKYGKQTSSVIGTCIQIGQYVNKKTICPLFIDDKGRRKFNTIMFVGKRAGDDEPGGYKWKLRPELYAALEEFGIERYLPGDDVEEETVPIRFVTGYKSPFSRNRIIFGAPGTGKSHTLNHEKDKLLENGGEYERVTFHPEYSYAHFVGTYKPVPCVDSQGNDAITYKYVPGPLMRTYVKALRNSREAEPQPYLLIVEEINRANVAAVFGDVFQLLDRDDDEASEYAIRASEDIKSYLADELGGDPEEYAEIRLPDNFFIWATMNSADQGVFPMDTAFKRRWDFEYLNINAGESGIAGKKVLLGNGGYERRVEWNELRRAINDCLSSFKINEDKLLGPYFLSRKVIPADGEIDAARFSSAFRNKVLMYLYDDAAKQKRRSLFADDVDTSRYSSVCEAFDERGVGVFCSEISLRFLSAEGEDE